ncbi:MAG: HAD-IC family P-type ATPase, partial [Peptococcaceae bacterium]|nr:HAD-IC family P-type ATPase [Peptococcaceae bacterium]
MDGIQALTVDQVYESLRTRPAGLNPAEVEKRRASAGKKPEVLRDVKIWAKKVARQFTHFFALMLWTAAGLCFFVEHFQPGEGMLTLGWTIILVIFINGAFSFAQEFRAEKAAQALQKLLPRRAVVVRGGKECEVPVDELVEGDVVILQEGDRVPADMRLVEAEGFQVNNATLTGESDVLARTAGPCRAESLFDADNIAFSGTLVLSGRAVGVVFAAGGRSQFGRVSRLTTGIKKAMSPLEREIVRVSKTLTVIALALGSVFFFLGLSIGRSVWENLLFAIGILVAVVPEWLLPTVTLTLAAGSQHMARKNALVKELSSIETLGCTTVICTDKTGTITENKMEVERVWLLKDSVKGRDAA